MVIRCKRCSKAEKFSNKRGSKISNRICKCGGSFEKLGGMYKVLGEHPFDKEKTHCSESGSKYFYADKNSNDVLFVYHDGYYYEVKGFII